VKITHLILLSISIASFAYAGNPLKTINKTSEKRINIESEVKAFYCQLTDNDPEIKNQIELLTDKTREEHGGIYHEFPLAIVKWFPSKEQWDVSKGSEIVAHYLVIQPIGYGRSKHAGVDSVLITEFEVDYNSVTALDENKPTKEEKLISNTLTITFLGFRDPSLTALPPKK